MRQRASHERKGLSVRETAKHEKELSMRVQAKCEAESLV